MVFRANKSRYDKMIYKRSGRSGLKLSLISLGMWHNFGGNNIFENGREVVRKAFDLGITHFDLANNYGPPPGSAEESFGEILKKDLLPYRDELIISTKAGYDMWPGPYGDFGSKKYLIASLDQSLNRLGLDYVDVFYHHRPDPDTPLEETMGALDSIVKQGKALYIGLSNYYDEENLKKALKILKELGTPCLIHQVRYSMFDRRVEDKVLEVTDENGAGTICFSPLEQGLLTNKYIKGIPEDSRMASSSVFLNDDSLTKERLAKINNLNNIAEKRGQTLAQMALAWVLRDKRITSVLVGASKVKQIIDNINTIDNLDFTLEELNKIENVLR
ncbi:MAG: aldo/keto reductase [Eubacteriales bacterium]